MLPSSKILGAHGRGAKDWGRFLFVFCVQHPPIPGHSNEMLSFSQSFSLPQETKCSVDRPDFLTAYVSV